VGVPVISGNVSFYNESSASRSTRRRRWARGPARRRDEALHDRRSSDEGDVIVLVGEICEELGGSEYLKVEHGRVSGRPPALDLELEMAVQAVVRHEHRAGS
jgi:phosphoribosylformylglycinamidine synthase subunit PurL